MIKRFYKRFLLWALGPTMNLAREGRDPRAQVFVVESNVVRLSQAVIENS